MTFADTPGFSSKTEAKDSEHGSTASTSPIAPSDDSGSRNMAASVKRSSLRLSSIVQNQDSSLDMYSSMNSDSLCASSSQNMDALMNNSLRRNHQICTSLLTELNSSKRSRRKLSFNFTLNTLNFWRLDLYGRDEEKKILLECFRRMKTPTDDAPINDASKQQRQLLLISGESGVGKTALVRELKAPVERACGFFLTGKFDLNQRQDPYSGIAAAVRALCMIILDMPRQGEKTEEEKHHGKLTMPSFHQIQTKLQEELGSDAQILVKLVPVLGEIVGQDIDGGAAQVGVNEAKNQFDFAFQRFLRVMCSFGPVALVMDDIQWSDASSMHLLEVLLSDRKINNFMVVGLYRSNEVNETADHLVNRWVKDIEARSQKDGIDIQKLELGNLAQPDVNDMLADLFSTDNAKTESLSKIVYKKTLGNVFFVIQFLQVLAAEEDLLHYNFGLDKWLWNEQKIVSSTMATGNVVNLMKVKISQLPSGVLQLLPLAACLGAAFSESDLALLADKMSNLDDYHQKGENVAGEEMEKESEETFNWLGRCVDQGLVEEIGPQRYQWLHDKIQEAALSLVAAEKLPALKFRVGEILCENLDAQLVDENIYVIVDLLGEYEQLAGPIPLSESLRLRIAELYLRAGEKANSTASFDQGAVYLQKGINLLPMGHWESHYGMSLEMFSSIAEAEFATGDVEVIAQEDRPIEDKLRAYNVLIDSIGGRNLLNDAIKIILSILPQLGCNMPKRGRDLRCLAGVIRLKATYKKLTPEKISKLQKMTEPKKIEAMKLLDKLVVFACFAKFNLLPLSILRQWRWTIKYGVSEFSPSSLIFIGALVVEYFGDIHGGKVYALHALSLLDKFNCRGVESRTLLVAYCLVLHWSTPVHECMKAELQAYETGMATGDLENAFWGVWQSIEFAFVGGRSLRSIEADFSIFTKDMKRYSLVYHLQCSILFWQCIRHLQEQSNRIDPSKLVGEVASSEFIRDLEERKEAGPVAMVHRMQIMLAYWYGDEDCGPELAVRFGEDFATANPGTIGGLSSRIQAAVICLDAGRRPGGQKYVRYGRTVARRVKSWVQGGNPNILQFDALFDAELAVLAKRHNVAARHYETAALLAARRGFRHDQAKINERYAEFALTIMNDEHEAEYRIKDAAKLYEEWGAHGKVKQLQDKYKQFFKESLPPAGGEIEVSDGADE